MTLKAADLQKTALALRAVGYEFVEEQHGDGPVHLASTNAEPVVEIYPTDMPISSDTMIGVYVASLDAVQTYCERQNVSVKRDRARVGDFHRMILETPEGAEIFVQEKPPKSA